MKRKFEVLSWSEWNWQRPFSEEDVKSLLGQLVGLTRRKSIVFEVRMTKNRVQYLLGTEEQDKRHIHQLIQSHRAIQFSRVSKREKTFGCTVSEYQRISLCFKNGFCRKYDTFKPYNFKNTSAR